MKLKTILSECWTGYVQRGMKNKGGRQVPNCVPESVNEDTSKKDIEKLTSYKDLSKFIKANKSKINSKNFNYIEDEVEALKYLESDYKRGKADRQEVEVAVIDAQDSIKRGMGIKVESVNEAKAPYEVYHKSYTSAIEAAREYAEKKGFEIDNDDSFRKIGMGPRKPSEGKTNSFSIQLSKETMNGFPIL